MKFFLITTDHFTDRLWFRDDEDFKAGMNLVAVCALSTGICILCFILMSNHLHFVVACEEDEAWKFINEFKQRYGIYFRWKYGLSEYFRRNGVDIREVTMADEALERAIAYVQMNCVAANICLTPELYPWGSGKCFFNSSPANGRPLSGFSRRTRMKMIHSSADVPGHFCFLPEGYISPDSYVDTKFVEGLFRSPKRMQYFLTTSSKARKILSPERESLPSFRDQIISEALNDLCHSLFRKHDAHDLSSAQLSELLKQLKYRFSADINQLARVCGLSYQDATSLLEST